MATKKATATVAEVLDDAKLHATYFRGLVAEGVGLTEAVSLTGSYIIACRMPKQESPKDPWEED